MSTARQGQTSTLLPNGKVLVAGGFSGANYVSSAELYDPNTGTWTPTGSLATARGDHSATLLPNGKILITGGYNGSVYVASAEVYDPNTGSWTSTGSLVSGRSLHTATLLPNGKVLVAGGRGGSSASAELYDPGTGTWASTGFMSTAREFHTATLLPNGKVLVAGGYNGNGYLGSAELYDPSKGTWASAGALSITRYGHTATLLPSGKVLIAGGYNGTSYLASAELYDSSAGTWASTGAMGLTREAHVAALLPNGKVLVAGGYNGGYQGGAELYDPSKGTWASTGSMSTSRYRHTATLLPSGRVLASGGYNGGAAMPSAELYDPLAGAWGATGAMGSARIFAVAALLPNGKVLVAGGSSSNTVLSSAEAYDPGTGSWASAGTMASARQGHRATLLGNGKVLLTGGNDGLARLASAELYDSGTGAWAFTGSLAFARQSHTATLLSNGKVLVVGGYSGADYLASAELYDPGTGTWTSTGSMASPRAIHTATLLPDGRVLVAGGTTASTLASAEIYDPVKGTWSATASMSSARYSHTATLLPNGKVLVAGGYNGSATVASAEVFDPGTGTWAPTGAMTSVRYDATAALLPNGKVLVAGGASGNLIHFATAEVFDPGTGTWTAVGSMASARQWHTATLLPGGRVLVAGGTPGSGILASAELYEDTGALDAWRPSVQPVALRPGASLTLMGTGFRGLSEASGGNTQSSATNFPLLSLQAVEGEAVTRMIGGNFSDTAVAATVPAVPDRYYLLTVMANGIPNGRMVLVDGTPPAAPVVTTPASGAFLNTPAPVISGTAEAGSTVAITLDGGVVGTVVASGSGSWSFTPGTALSEGAHSVTAQATDAAGNTSAASSARAFTVDTTAPATPVIVSPASNVVGGNSGLVISGTAEAGCTVILLVNGTTAETTVANGSGNWSVTLSTSLSDGTFTVTARAKDAAGNLSPFSSSRIFIVDTVPPPVPIVVTPASGAFVNTAAPVILGTAEAGSTVTVSVDGAAVGSGVASGTGNWSVTPGTALSQGTHSITVQATDAAGNVSTASGTRFFTVDTVAPGAPVVVSPASGAVVNTATPVISGTAEANSTVTVSMDGTVAGTAVADGSGSWSFTPSTALSQGAHAVTAQAMDAAGNSGPASSARAFTVDTVTPPVPVVVTPASGAFVKTATPIISGMAGAGSTVSISVDGIGVGTALVDGSGTWSFTPSAQLANGAHSVTAQASTTAGNTSPVSSPRSFTVDTVAPPVPVVVAPANGAVSHNPRTPITGTAEAGSTITVFLDGVSIGTTQANGDGAWSFTPETALGEGTHTLTVTATDSAGNTSAPSSSSTLVVNTRGPATPVVTSPAAGAVVDVRRPVITGTGEVETLVTVILDGVETGTEPVSNTGTWSFTPAEDLPLGSHTLSARSVDPAQQQSPASVPTSFTITSRGQYWGCAAAPTSTAGWVAVALGLGCLSRRRREPRVQPVRIRGKRAWAVLCLGWLAGSKAFGAEPTVPPAAPAQPGQQPSALGFMLGVRSEAEVLKQGFTPALTAELSGDSDASLPDVRLGAALTALFRPMGLRAEGRLYPYDVGAAGKWRVRPYLALGATALLKTGGVGARGGVGAALQLGSLQLFADVAYERFLTRGDTYYYEPNAVVLSLGVGWSPFSRR